MREIQNIGPDAATLVSGAIVLALLDRLVERDRLSEGDVKDILTAGSIAIQSRTRNSLRDEAERVISHMLHHWSNR